MPTPPTDPLAHDEQEPPRLLGSKAADIVAGIIAAALWWTVGIAVSSIRGPSAGLVVALVALAFVIQLIVLGAWVRGAKVFVITQILTAVLLPLLAAGLLFGACLLSSGSFH